MRNLAAIAIGVAVLGLPLAAAGCGSDEAADGRPTVVVTTPVLGAVVERVVGDAARVDVVMPNGIDPHDFQPSAKDVEAISRADLVVENGLDLEEGLEDALDRARDDGVPVFTAADHVDLREATGGDAHSGDDPHIWMDPLAMRDVAAALGPVLRADLGLDVGAAAARAQDELTALDGEVREIVASIPPAGRKLVTGHESMGYFADRYGFELVGAIIPSLSSQAQASAAALAELRDQVRATGVPVIFTEIGTPEGVAQAIADETGARVVDVATHTLPDDGSYATFIREAAEAVRGGLTAPPPA